MVDPHERAILELLAAHGPLGWHGVATRLGRLDARNLVHVLDGLTARGLLATDGPAEKTQWALTALGRKTLAPHPPGPLTPDELVAWARDLTGEPTAVITRVYSELADPPRLLAALLQVLAAAEASARGVVLALGCLDPDTRLRLAETLTTDPRPAVRAAFYTGFAPLRLDIPGQAARLFPDEACAAIVRRGLADPDREVRAQATTMVFGTCLGAHVSDALLANLETGDHDLRWRTLAALGGATDDDSRAALEQHLDGPDLGLACMAVQALGARADGRALCRQRAERDAREPVRNAAHHALAVAASLAEKARRRSS